MEAKANSQEAKAEGKGAAAPPAEEDLSMEEILQSIRKIIAEDDKDGKKPAKAKDEEEEVIPGSDVFELTDMIKEDGSVVNLKEEAAPSAPEAAPPADVLNKINEALTPDIKPAEAPVKPEPIVETKPAAAAPVEVPATPVAPAPADSLLSEAAASASIESLNKLKAADQYVPPAPVSAAPSFRDGTTVEDLVTEMLRPMMKTWLDNNLPQIVERIVEREIRKLTK